MLNPTQEKSYDPLTHNLYQIISILFEFPEAYFKILIPEKETIDFFSSTEILNNNWLENFSHEDREKIEFQNLQEQKYQVINSASTLKIEDEKARFRG